MTLVHTAALPPFKCALSGLMEGPFVDTGFNTKDDPLRGIERLYIQKGIMQNLAREVGMVPQEDLDLAREKHQSAVQEIKDLRAQLADADKRLDAFELVKG